MVFTPVKPSWIKFFAICNHRIDYRFIAIVILLSVTSFSQPTQACVVSCKSNLNVSLDEFGQAVITPSILLQDPSCNPNDFTVNITGPQGNSFGNLLTCANIGMTMTATVTKISNGNSCSTIIFVSDHINPVIYCQDTTILCIEPANPAAIGFPSAWDNCSSFTNNNLNYTDEFIDLACFAMQGNDIITSKIKRVWTATDASGNVGTCTQMIYLKRATIDDVDFPLHRDGFILPALDCNDDPSDLALTGQPTINGKTIEIGGNCEIVVSYSDQVIGLCSPASFQILRTWTAIDYCSSDFTMNVQIIKVKDQTPPQIICPVDITVGTTSNSCKATVILPFASATDDCSGFVINPTWSFGSGYGPFFNVPIGVYNVTYTALDACGNNASCSMKVTVVDDVAPVPICDLSIDVNLNYFGTVLIEAATFDNSSFDNCGIASMLASRDGINYSSTVTFNCEDIDSGSIPVNLRVWDTSGNFNECEVVAIIDDKINPVISCPPNIYIECDEDYTNLNLTGEPTATDNCGIDSVYYHDIVALNSCGVGSITRTWTVLDKKENSASCVQMIYIQDNTPIGVAFPQYFVTYDCTADPDPSESGEPQISNDNCEQISIVYTDNVFNISPSCMTILRKWEVFNWCVYVPNSGSGNGYWTDTQIIEVFDAVAPVLSCPSNAVFGMFSSDCGGEFINIPSATAIDCNPFVSITNDSPYAENTGADASGYYPPGVHNINFFAEDGCGNTSSCSMQVVVVDAKAPTPICLEIAVSLGLNGTVTITPEMINYGSYDNCTAPDNLLFEVSPNVFTCDELGDQTVILTVTDEEGNSSFCETVISIQDNNAVCQLPSAKIKGLVVTETGAPVQLTSLVLSGDVSDTTANEATGYFEFPELPVGGNYLITPAKDVFPLNGVSTFDLIFIRRHILNIQPLNSPYKIIAADINRSGSISAFDIVLLSKLILQIDTDFTSNTSWRFVDASFVFPNPSNPFFTTFPESKSIIDLNENEPFAEFIGVKTGDVNGSVDPAELDEIEIRNDCLPLVLEIPNQQVESGKEYAVGINASDSKEILGYQFTLEFDQQALEFVEVEKGILDDLDENNFGFTHLEKGLITTNWINQRNTRLKEGDALFVLKFKAKKSGEIKDLIKINSAITKAEAYTSDFQIIDIEPFYKEFLIDNVNPSGQAILYQNYPNPFNENTVIGFDLPGGGDCQLLIFNVEGQQIFSRDFYAQEGYNEIKIDKKEFRKSGLYYYHLCTPSRETLIKKLIVN